MHKLKSGFYAGHPEAFMKTRTKLWELIVIGTVIAIGMAGCGAVEVGDRAWGFMPGFLTNMVARGFWWAVLATFIFGIPLMIIGFLLTKINKILGNIVMCIPGIFFNFYIWHIRGHVIWLVFAILLILAAPRSIYRSIVSTKNP
jgi:hypothetical protein